MDIYTLNKAQTAIAMPTSLDREMVYILVPELLPMKERERLAMQRWRSLRHHLIVRKAKAERGLKVVHAV